MGLAAAALLLPGVPAMAQPAFVGDPPLQSDTGQVPLEWAADGPVTITIADTAAQTGRTIFGGSGEAMFLSGLADGDYTLSIAPEGGAITDTIAVEVRHQSLSRALWLTALGGLVFLLILGVILRGARHG